MNNSVAEAVIIFDVIGEATSNAELEHRIYLMLSYHHISTEFITVRYVREVDSDRLYQCEIGLTKRTSLTTMFRDQLSIFLEDNGYKPVSQSFCIYI